MFNKIISITASSGKPLDIKYNSPDVEGVILDMASEFVKKHALEHGKISYWRINCKENMQRNLDIATGNYMISAVINAGTDDYAWSQDLTKEEADAFFASVFNA